jgi:hypothetical protein
MHSFNIMVVHPACVFTMLDILYTVYTPRVSSVLSLHVSSLLGHHQVTKVYNFIQYNVQYTKYNNIQYNVQYKIYNNCIL